MLDLYAFDGRAMTRPNALKATISVRNNPKPYSFLLRPQKLQFAKSDMERGARQLARGLFHNNNVDGARERCRVDIRVKRSDSRDCLGDLVSISYVRSF
jgi:hypothetical protein